MRVNRDLIHDDALWCNPSILSDLRAATEYRARNDEGASAYVSVVGYENSVVNLDIRPYGGWVHCSLTNRYVAADFHTVSDFDAAYVSNADGF
ncbi:hypothetical protein [Nocardioides gilvus]|uniref:hypothetical protein n=1 Tax=Nocardioides gilvus TaxID=1735589 RepID=UPI001EF66F11|nr:hypothetical protein [Nocardioides gilvus]